MNKTNTVTRLIKPAFILVSMAGLLMLQGCSSSNNPPASPATDASGFYTDGTATIDGTDVSDLTAIIYNDRLMMFTSTLNVLYDGAISENADGSFTSTVDIYQTAVKLASTANITGNINNRSQVTGTMTGTGVGNVTFTLVFNDLYDRDATLPRIVTDVVDPLDPFWEGAGSSADSVPPTTYIGMDFLTNTTLVSEISGSNIIPICSSENGSFSLANQVNVYEISMDIVSNLSCNVVGTNFTGFATVIDSDPLSPGSDDVLIMAISNGTNSTFGIISK